MDLIERVSVSLLKGRTWRYLRYLHFREFLRPIAPEITTVCVCGAGHGMAELALAAEFPHIEFTLTDILDKQNGYPNYHNSMALAWREGIDNIRYSVWNVLDRTHRRFDLVASTEMLEHIENDARAAENMVEASNRFVYCAVPFATPEYNGNPNRRAQVLERHQHHVLGYDLDTLAGFFPNVRAVAGVGWTEFGFELRQKLHTMSDKEIEAEAAVLKRMAHSDLLDRRPENPKDVQGIKILSEVKT